MQRTPRISGCIAPMFTPFYADGSLDWDGVAAFVDWLSEQEGLDAIFVRSGMGQTHLWQEDEIRKAPAVAVEASRGRVPILVGTSGVWNRDVDRRPDPERYIGQTIEFSQIAEEVGATPVVLVPAALPADSKPAAQRQTRLFFERVCNAVDTGVFVYHRPGLPEEYVFDQELLRELLQIPNLVGIKVSTSDESLIEDLGRAAREREDFAYICGNERKATFFLERGAVGVIGQGTTLYPLLIKRCIEYFRVGELDRAQQVQQAIIECCDTFQGMDTAVAGKVWLRTKGVNMSPYKRPPEPLPTIDEVLQRARRIEKWLNWARQNKP